MNKYNEAMQKLNEAVETLDELVTKSIPKKINLEGDKTDNWYFCDRCGEELLSMGSLKLTKNYYNYCPHCGQRLDWSDEE